MPNDTKTALTVAAAFAAALMVTPVTQAQESVAVQAPQNAELRPSAAALERLEEAAQTAWIWWPWPPRDIWMEVTHVESVKPKTA